MGVPSTTYSLRLRILGPTHQKIQRQAPTVLFPNKCRPRLRRCIFCPFFQACIHAAYSHAHFPIVQRTIKSFQLACMQPAVNSTQERTSHAEPRNGVPTVLGQLKNTVMPTILRQREYYLALD